MDREVTAEPPPPSLSPPQVQPRSVEPASVSRAPSSNIISVRTPLWVVAVVAIGAVVAVGALIVLYQGAANDRDDGKRALAESRASLADARASVIDVESRLADAQAALTDAEANLADSIKSLADAEAQVAGYRNGASYLGRAFVATDRIPEADAACIADAIVESRGPEALTLFADGMWEDSVELVAEFLRAADDCDVPLDSIAPETGVSYGDNPDMDALYDECAAGAGASCDTLYNRSDVRTEYEAFGLTCGNRFTPEGAPPACEGVL